MEAKEQPARQRAEKRELRISRCESARLFVRKERLALALWIKFAPKFLISECVRPGNHWFAETGEAPMSLHLLPALGQSARNRSVVSHRRSSE